MSSTSINISNLLRKTEQVFSKADIPSPRLDAEILLAHALDVTRPYLHAHSDTELHQGASLMQFEHSVERRMRREPIAYIIGKKEFYGREFIVTPDVLIPRPETEELIDLALAELDGRRMKEEGREANSRQPTAESAKIVRSKDRKIGEGADSRQRTADRGERGTDASEPDTTSAIHLQPESALLRTQGRPGAKPWSGSTYLANGETQKILDVGCGSGCIGITLKLERPELDVTLCDISSKALEIARQNAKELNANVSCIESDLLSSFILPPSSFSLIVANLPYVDKTWETSPETAFEPSLALYAEHGGLELMEKLIEQSVDVLQPGGFLLLEADPEQHEALRKHAAHFGLAFSEASGYAISFVNQP